MIQSPDIDIVASVTGRRQVQLRAVNGDDAAEFGAFDMSDPRVHDYLMQDLADDHTFAWSVRNSTRGRQKTGPLLGIVAISEVDKLIPDQETESSHCVWYGQVRDEYSPIHPRRMYAGTLAVAAATGFGLRLHDQIRMMEYRIFDGSRNNVVLFSEADRLGFRFTGSSYFMGDTRVRELLVDRARFGCPQDGDFVSHALNKFGRRFRLESPVAGI